MKSGRSGTISPLALFRTVVSKAVSKLIWTCRINQDNMPAECLLRRLNIGSQALYFGIWIKNDRKGRAARKQFIEKFDLLSDQNGVRHRDAGKIATGPTKACDQAFLHRIAGHKEHDRDVTGCCLSSASRRGAADCRDYGHIRSDEIGGERRKQFWMTSRPPVFNRNILAFQHTQDRQGRSENRVRLARFQAKGSRATQSPVVQAAAPSPPQATPPLQQGPR